MLARWRRRLRRMLHGGSFPVWYDPRYRLTLSSLDRRVGMEGRRADHVVTYLLERGLVRRQDVRTPRPASYDEMARVHTRDYLDALTHPETLGAVFAVDPDELNVDDVLTTVRLACGGTLAAARESLARGLDTLNLLGGFHHAAPDRGSGLSAVNDIAVAIADLRARGFRGRVAIVDLDAHPPDGTALCIAGDERVWLGSISGSSWGPIDGADETVLGPGASDREYLATLDVLLGRMPKAHIAFVIAGGDVLSGDRMGLLRLSLAGARQRDLNVAEALAGVPTVWLPGGGYHPDAWRVLAGTALAAAEGSSASIDVTYDALQAQFGRVAATLQPEDLGSSSRLELDDLMLGLGARPSRPRLLGFYTAQGIEHALSRYGVLAYLERLGFRRFRVEIDARPQGDRARLFATLDGQESMLIECVLERQVLAERPVLFVHWLLMRDPTRHLDTRQAPLPGQEHPGLGLGRELGALLGQMANRLGLAGVAYQPAWYHMACGVPDATFVDPARQGRFEALQRDLGALPLAEATRAVAEGRVRLGGEPYAWEPEPMVRWLEPAHDDRDEEIRRQAREGARFELERPA